MTSDILTSNDIFQCACCGECCNGFGGTYVSMEDIERIALFVKTEPENFTQTYCDVSGNRYVLTQGEDGKCIFFDSEKYCTIHPVKPDMCRAWPFIAAVVREPSNWDLMASTCPGMKKHVAHEELVRIVARERKEAGLSD